MTNYSNALSNIQNKIYSSNIDNYEGRNKLNFLRSTSCKNFYFPNYKEYSDHEFYQRVKINQELTVYELANFKEIKNNLEISNPPSISQSPKIYCSFHFGSYRIISCILHEQNIDFAVISNKTVIDNSKEELVKNPRPEDVALG